MTMHNEPLAQQQGIHVNVYAQQCNAMYSLLKKIVNEHPVSYFNVLKAVQNQQLRQWIDAVVPQLDGYKISTKCNWILAGRTSFPMCSICGQPFGMNINIAVSSHYSSQCPRCARKTASYAAKHTVESKHALDPHYYDAIVAKRRHTTSERHGSPTWNNQEQTRATCLDKYGVDNVRKSTQCKRAIKRTKLANHGDENWTNLEKTSQTCLDRYGVAWPMQSPEIRAKSASKYAYDGCEFDSKHELCYYIWLRDNRIDFTFKPGIKLEYMHDSKLHLYIPDFIVRGCIVEIKGDHFFKEDGTMQNPYDHSQDLLYEAKHQCMLANNVKIILQSECGEYVAHVCQKYGKDFIKSCRTPPKPAHDHHGRLS